MKCVDVENCLDDYIDDRIDSAISKAIKFHLHECNSCQKEAGGLQQTRRLLKTLPAVTPSNQFDAQMMQAFRARQQKNIKPAFWTTVFANFSISKPALTFGLLACAATTFLAFQLGRMTSPTVEIAETQNIRQSSQLIEEKPPVQIVEKRVEIPVIKTVEVPVCKEKIVYRVLYKDREVVKTIKVSDKKEDKIRDTDFDLQNTAANIIQNSNENFTSINLKDFQPFAEIKINIIKRGKDDKK